MAVTFTEKKCECRVCLYRVERGETPLTVEPIKGLIHIVEASLGTHPFWFGIVELPVPDRSLLETFIGYRCDLVLEDKRQGTAAIPRVFAKDDYLGLCVSGITPLVVEDGL
jgi:hypothetical protein